MTKLNKKELGNIIYPESPAYTGATLLGVKLKKTDNIPHELTIKMQEAERNSRVTACPKCGSKAIVDRYTEVLSGREMEVVRCAKKTYQRGENRIHPCKPFKREAGRSGQE